MSRFQGIGTDYYGKKDYNRQDGSYVAVKWFVFLLLPIIPLKCFRIRKLGQYTDKNYIIYRSETTQYQILAQMPLGDNVGLVIKTYAFVYGFLAALIGSFILCSFYPERVELVAIPMALLSGCLIWYLVKH